MMQKNPLTTGLNESFIARHFFIYFWSESISIIKYHYRANLGTPSRRKWSSRWDLQLSFLSNFTDVFSFFHFLLDFIVFLWFQARPVWLGRSGSAGPARPVWLGRSGSADLARPVRLGRPPNSCYCIHLHIYVHIQTHIYI